ncbi:sensor histidine kinase [Dokdonella sp. MW10]|uniref:sensor histidine kinase n=1 Tax=Dokdonella sp. MW10 TaxID=2992926 RepID=UPI003F7EE2FF
MPTFDRPRGLALMFGWRRVRAVAIAVLLISLLLGFGWKSGWWSLAVRVAMLAFVAMVAFGVFEQWPSRLPRWIARWVLQVVAVALVMPVAVVTIYMASTPAGAPPFWEEPDRLSGFGMLLVFGVLIAPWVALGALVRQKEALAREHELALDLTRSELERQALDARLRLLQAQVAPHFLFNTLANVQALVAAGSPRAPAVLDSLTAYLRASVPRLGDGATTLGDELRLVRAYLELMHLRMPDRLRFALHVDEGMETQVCPPMTLLTLVENAVRHGIDPAEEGGRIDVHVERVGTRCLMRVVDTGVGLGASERAGLGTGLATLRERLRLAFGVGAHVRIEGQYPHGTSAELDLPLREVKA